MEAGRPHQRGDCPQARPLARDRRAHAGPHPRDVAPQVGRSRPARAGEVRAARRGDGSRRRRPNTYLQPPSRPLARTRPGCFASWPACDAHGLRFPLSAAPRSCDLTTCRPAAMAARGVSDRDPSPAGLRGARSHEGLDAEGCVAGDRRGTRGAGPARRGGGRRRADRLCAPLPVAREARRRGRGHDPDGRPPVGRADDGRLVARLLPRRGLCQEGRRRDGTDPRRDRARSRIDARRTGGGSPPRARRRSSCRIGSRAIAGRSR